MCLRGEVQTRGASGAANRKFVAAGWVRSKWIMRACRALPAAALELKRGVGSQAQQRRRPNRACYAVTGLDLYHLQMVFGKRVW